MQIVLFWLDFLFNPFSIKNLKVLGLKKFISSLSELIVIILIIELFPILFIIFSI
jgi:hypothetical protein